MALSMMKCVAKSAASNDQTHSYVLKLLASRITRRSFAAAKAASASDERMSFTRSEHDIPDDAVPTSGISRPLFDILKELNKKVPDSLVRVRSEPDGFPIKYIPWHIVNRIMNLHAPEWSGEVRSITYSADGNSVSVVYRVTLYGTDAEMYRESTGTAPLNVEGYGDPVQKAEAMAFRRACARFGLGLHLYHEDML
ncbi:DNA repair RAD52-like protein 1, mitochondrial [Cornus florida]|uniref:DNA repair RAD52-like protein 1, mitochondrial n=1 Tax=Cornus florida TaxID=4283 RepID=UPI0028A03F5F|nr:DNA repair RAD52-like protein 1, mitochondrial [Cornus florida]